MSFPPAPARPVPARSVIRPLLTVAFLFTCVGIATYISLMTMTGQSLDDEALAQAKADRNNFFPWIFLAAAQHVPELVSIAAAVLALVWTIRTRRWIPAVVGLGMILGANFTTQFLKRVLLDKPDFGIQHIVHNSFPSGHTTATATILVTLLLVAPPHLRAKTASWGWVLAAITGMLTVLNGWHRPSDAAAALLIVGGWGVLAVLAIRFADDALARPGARPTDVYRRVRQKIDARRENLQQREDRGDSAYIPPAGPQHQQRHQQYRPLQPGVDQSGSREFGNPRFGTQGPTAASYPNAPYQNSPNMQARQPYPPAGFQQNHYGHPGYAYRATVRPRRGTVITLLVLAIGLAVTVALMPSVAVAGTWAGRATVIAGYLGIAAAAALSWRSVARWLRSLS